MQRYRRKQTAENVKSRQGTSLQHRRGVTLIEVLTVLAVIGLLLAILIPAVQSAREANRRLECQNRLKNIGAALHGYESAQGKFPPIFIDSGINRRAPRPVHYSNQLYAPHVHLLPYLDQAALFQQFDLSQPQPPAGDGSRLKPAARTVLPVFNCPSDPRLGGNNYRFCTGSGPSATDLAGTVSASTDPGSGGAFTDLSGHRDGDFRDGMSNTAALAEKIKSDDNPAGYSAADFFYAGVPLSVLRTLDADGMARICSAQTYALNPNICPFVGHSWFTSGYVHALYNHVLVPNGKTPDCSEGSHVGESTFGAHKASSHHPGGVNVLMLDGRVIFVSNSIDLALWRAMGTRAKGEHEPAVSLVP